ncbi:TonB-dependent receptor [Thermomonas sp. XSG]|uniref:TonB-dependent receptor domain-containing protein n=1 Tax=Thermomonas sp. XSG TaxID=2771436 RepID=UPI001680D668|nr:TonB-dependent receptor [Thermomonas sp. XSG]QNU14838.1 TonB-dependent receptor [Thermomonas sp. XSG]
MKFHRDTVFRLSPLALALALPGLASAHGDDATDLDKVVVTATRTASTADAALAAVEVIDRAQIDASSARSLPELLRGRAGITLVNQGGLGKLSTLFLRGTESDHTLFLIDGVRVGSPASGLTMLQDLPLAQIERIEIVRGPRSSLYGADAIGGVIQIFTRRGEAEGVRGRGRIAAGSHGLREASAGVDLRGKRGGVGVDVAHQETDGINACRGFYDPATWAGAGCFIVPGTHLDHDGYRNSSASLRADFAASDGWQIDARATRAEGHNDYDGDYVDNSDIVQQTVGGSVRWAAASDVQLKLTVGRNSDDSDNRLGSTFSNRFTTTRDSASLQADLTVAQGQLLSAGFDWLRDRATIVDPWSPFAAARGNRAVFAQYQGDFGAHDLQLSLRSDRNDQFGGHLTGGLAWGMDIADGWRVTASHGTAFKAPSFNELYYPGYSNPLLRPEASRSSEVSLQRSGDGWQVQANAYHTRIDDLIAWDASLGKPGNVEQARIRGLELAASVALGEWDLRGQLGWLDARNASTGFNHDKRLARRPTRSARIDLDRKFGNWGFGLSAIGEAARWDDVSNSLRVGGYGTLDGRVSWRFAPAWTLQANVVNLFDKRYETSAWYVQPGREYALSLRWQPQ